MNRRTWIVAPFALLIGVAVASLWPRAQAQEVKAENGRYQLSVIPGAAYVLDTRTGDLHVREYQTKRWTSAGNPFKSE